MINNLLEVLERSIAEYFYSLFVGQVKIRHNSLKYSAILHTETSNKIYVADKSRSYTSFRLMELLWFRFFVV